MKLAPEAQDAIRRSTLKALWNAKGHQGDTAAALGIHRRSLQKRLASLFTAAERAQMAVQWGWRGTKEKT